MTKFALVTGASAGACAVVAGQCGPIGPRRRAIGRSRRPHESSAGGSRFHLDNTVLLHASLRGAMAAAWGSTRADGAALKLEASSSAARVAESQRSPQPTLPAGIGLAIARELLALGYTVFANGRNEARLIKAFSDLPDAQRSRVM
jgi:hypothetical protein